MAGLGRRTFTAGEVLTAANVQNYLQDQAVMVFAGTAARASAIPTPTEGMVTYQTDTNQLTYYDGANWDQIAPLDSPTFTGTVGSFSMGTNDIAFSGSTGGIVYLDGPTGTVGGNLTLELPLISTGNEVLVADTTTQTLTNKTLTAPVITGSGTVNSGRLGSVVGGLGTTTSGSNLTVTHGLGTTPTAVNATIRINTYTSTNNANIFVGNIGATTFTVFANNGAGGAVSAAFNWIAVA